MPSMNLAIHLADLLVHLPQLPDQREKCRPRKWRNKIVIVVFDQRDQHSNARNALSCHDAELRHLGLNPSVRQSGEGPAYHGRITKQGRSHARGMLVEAAWAAARSPGPLRAFYKRLASRRGKHIAAVATARKLVMIIWHTLSKCADYIWARPALLARKFRSIELRAGLPTRHAKRGTAFDYNIPAKRAKERTMAEKAEAAYVDLTSRWRTRKGKRQWKSPFSEQ